MSDESSLAMAPVAPFILRIAVGLIFFMHGWQKLMGGVEGVSGLLTGLGFPLATMFAVLLIAAELVGGAFLILGLWTRLTARILAVVALVAWLTVHLANGFFASGGGYEFIMLIFAACVALAITGPGKWALGPHMARTTV